MYDEHYLKDAILGWRNEHKEDPLCGFNKLLGMVKEIYATIIEQDQDTRFLKYDAILPETKFKTTSMGCSVKKETCESCSGTEKNPITVAIPSPPNSVPNANGDVFVQSPKQNLMSKKCITGNQVNILLHTVGYPKYFRNYFAVDTNSSNWDDIQVLVDMGIMETCMTSGIDAGLHYVDPSGAGTRIGLTYFRVTKYGMECLKEAGFSMKRENKCGEGSDYAWD